MVTRMLQQKDLSEAEPSGGGDVPVTGQALLLGSLCALYVGFGAVLGLIQGGLPAIIMASGWGPGRAGWAYAFYMPFGLAFLWAPLVDRVELPFPKPRAGWVFWMQAITILAVTGIAVSPDDAYVRLILLGFAAAFAMATMDLALDGVAVETVGARFRGWAAGTKMAGLASGSMIGGGLLVARFETWGRDGTFLVLVAILAVIVVPFLLLGLPGAGERSARTGASLLRLFADRTGRRRLMLLIVVSIIIFPASGLNRMMLVAIGVPLEQIGWLVGMLGPVGMIVASVAAIPLINLFGHRMALLVFGGLSLASILLMLAGVIHTSQSMALVGAVVIGGGVSGIFIVYAAKILGWARGAQPVTDYAAFYGIGRFAAALAMLLSAQVVQVSGWAAYFATLAGAFALLLLHFNRKDDT